MKKLLPLPFLFILMTILCGCPYDSPYNIDEDPQENIDMSLLGSWTALVTKPSDDKHVKQELVKLIISRRTDKEYDITITGHIDELRPYHMILNDSIKGTACISNLAGKRFLNSFIYGRVYISELLTDGNLISILPMAEHFISKFVKNCRELRAAVEFHYKMRLTPGYDKLFALRNLQREN